MVDAASIVSSYSVICFRFTLCLIWDYWHFHNGNNRIFQKHLFLMLCCLTPLPFRRLNTREKQLNAIIIKMPLIWFLCLLAFNSYSGAVCDTAKLCPWLRRFSLNFTSGISRIGIKIVWRANILGLRWRYICKQIYLAGAECWSTAGKVLLDVHRNFALLVFL